MAESIEIAAPRRRQRRKDARPGEILAAAIEVFAEKGFWAAKLEEVARRAGISKGTVFLYFPTKQDLFREVARSIVNSDFERIAGPAADLDRPLSEFIPMLLEQAAALGESRVAAVITLVIAEAKPFPELARVWHDEVVGKMIGLLTSVIERAQARGEIVAGDPRLHAFSILGPMLACTIFREVFRESEEALPDLRKLASQHAATIVRGLQVPAGRDLAER